MSKQPHDIEEFLSRRQDRELSDQEAFALNAALQADPAARRIAEEYERLEQLLGGWRALPDELQWASFRHNVTTAIGKEVETAASAQADVFIRDSLSPLPDVDWSAFKQRVVTAVQREPAAHAGTKQKTGLRRSRWLRVSAWATPFAAAAAIVLTVFLRHETASVVPQPFKSPKSLIQASLYVPKSNGTISFTFDRTPAAVTPEDSPAESGTAIAIGPPRTEALSEAESDVTEDAFLY